jgi:hypothetical protein
MADHKWFGNRAVFSSYVYNDLYQDHLFLSEIDSLGKFIHQNV